MCSTQMTISALPRFVLFTTTSTLTDLSSQTFVSTLLTSENTAFTLITSLPTLAGVLLLFLNPIHAILMQFTSSTPISVSKAISIKVDLARLWMDISFMSLLIFSPRFSLSLG
ncbi:hypothetical protein LINPERPRIM_LOCUS17326 [Linum perenne]